MVVPSASVIILTVPGEGPGEGKYPVSSMQMNDYAEVPERVLDFYKKYPEGSLRSTYVLLTVPNKNGQDAPHWVVTTQAFRTPDDPSPSVGMAKEAIPGFTPYTKGSELENAETSAWGRALAAAGFIANKKIASANEVRNRRAEQEAEKGGQEAPTAKPNLLTPAQVKRLGKRLTELNVNLDASLLRLQSYGVEAMEDLSPADAADMVRHFESLKAAA
jgi:hypothetical protein